jgi:hypothetical protein
VTVCFLAQFADTPCHGHLDAAHLIPKQRIRRELKSRGMDAAAIREVIWHPSVLVPGCRRHHGDFDVARTLRVPREALPPAVFAWAEQWELMWSIDRDFPRTEEAA